MRTRKWLVPNGSVDSYLVVEATPPAKKYRHYNYYHIDLKIADCDRHVTIGFGWSNDKQRRSQLRKLDRLQSGLDLVRTHLEPR